MKAKMDVVHMNVSYSSCRDELSVGTLLPCKYNRSEETRPFKVKNSKTKGFLAVMIDLVDYMNLK